MRADKKSSVKKAREKAERITIRGVRIAACPNRKRGVFALCAYVCCKVVFVV